MCSKKTFNPPSIRERNTSKRFPVKNYHTRYNLYLRLQHLNTSPSARINVRKYSAVAPDVTPCISPRNPIRFHLVIIPEISARTRPNGIATGNPSVILLRILPEIPYVFF